MARPRLHWIKLYQQILTSDIMTLPEAYRWNFVGLLLVASDEPERGKIREHWLANNRKLLANRLGTSTKLLANSLQSLAELGAIIEDNNELSIINYVNYQGLTPNKPEKPVKKSEKTDEDIPGEKEKENKKQNEEIDIIIDYLNTVTNSQFRKTKASRTPIRARLKEGFSVEDCKRVIDNKAAAWLQNPDMAPYLRPQTLFAPTKFEGYLNEKKGGRLKPATTEEIEQGMEKW